MLRRLLSLLLMMTLLFCAVLPAACAEDDADIYGDEDTSAGYVTLKRGDRDGDDSANIVLLQNALIELGYLSDTADGVYGANTESAVACFQRSNGLEETGSADVATQTKLYSGDELVPYSSSMDTSSIVSRTQKMLTRWGFLVSAVDGVAGDKTNDAVAAFKAYLRGGYLKAYPTPTPAPTPEPTLSSGFGDGAVVIDKPLEDASEISQLVLDFVDGNYEFEVYRQTVASGDTGDEVLRVQRRLYQLKYLYGADGEFGSSTERSLLYFQRKNGLNQTGVADEATQRLLFSESAVESEEYVCPYKLVVDISDQYVYAYQWNGSSYGTCVREMICSTGLNDTPTPKGSYQAIGPSGSGEWYYFKKYNCYAKWGYHIVGGIMFHSVTYTAKKKLVRSSVNHLGHKASHGCIRLEIENAKWIYDNCPSGTTVVVQA